MSHCACTDPGHSWSGTPTGSEVSLADGLTAYVATPPTGIAMIGAILWISDIFGIFREAVNPRLWCDRLAAKGFAVLAPDFFRGGAYPADQPLSADAFGAWLAKFPRDKTMADMHIALDYIKGTLAPGLPISAVGFCWGGQYVALLAGEQDPAIAAGAMLHPSLITPDDIQAIARPVFVATNGADQQVSPEFRAQIQDILAAKPFPTATQHWEDMRHGWTLRGDDKDAAIAKAAEEAFNRTVDWFTVHGSKE